jgi:hypothetical protein
MRCLSSRTTQECPPVFPNEKPSQRVDCYCRSMKRVDTSSSSHCLTEVALSRDRPFPQRCDCRACTHAVHPYVRSDRASLAFAVPHPEQVFELANQRSATSSRTGAPGPAVAQRGRQVRTPRRVRLLAVLRPPRRHDGLGGVPRLAQAVGGGVDPRRELVPGQAVGLTGARCAQFARTRVRRQL